LEIKIESPSKEKLESLEVSSWGIWESEIKKFPWEYEATEMCYILEGKVIVITEAGDKVEINKGDFVTFPKGLKCTWDVKQPIKKHYRFE